MFDHVQRMPVAFFTRTRTGALVSRLNNDVIGAQRAFSDTLSGVVSNVVMLALTLVVMLGLSWQITLLALMLLPVFVSRRGGWAPAGRAAARGGRPQRGDEHPDDRAVLRARARRWSSCSGGRPRSPREFVARARRVRDIGVRTAMVQWVFVTALTLVSALALALVYGLGGYLALSGGLDAGDVVSLALLLTRLYAPADRAGQRAARGDERAGQLRAGLRGARPAAADRASRAGRRAAARRSGVGGVRRRVASRYPSADKVSLASLEEVATARHPRRRRGAARRVVPRRAGADGRAGRLVGRRASPRSRSCCPGSTTSTRARCGWAGSTCATCRSTRCARRWAWSPRTGTCSTSRSGPTCCWPGPEATEDELWDALRRARLAELVAALPDGLDTVVGERGYRLSGGERQRLTIARLLLARPRVVVLDEATAHLDSTSEAAVQEALAEALAGRPRVVIAHRLSTIRAADLILVIEDGRIVERGTHPELLAARRPLRRAVPHPVRPGSRPGARGGPGGGRMSCRRRPRPGGAGGAGSDRRRRRSVWP